MNSEERKFFKIINEAVKLDMKNRNKMGLVKVYDTEEAIELLIYKISNMQLNEKMKKYFNLFVKRNKLVKQFWKQKRIEFMDKVLELRIKRIDKKMQAIYSV